MIKIYGMESCPHCAYIYEQIEGDERFETIDIGEHVGYLSEFLRLRDANPAFDNAKKVHDVGIPCFVLEDGTVTLDPADVGLVEYSPSAQSCSLDGRGC